MNKVSDITIRHESFISLHAQLHNRLRQLILSGRWAHGTRIPSESQLTRHLNISRSTVRLALQQCEVEGLIERMPGKGTFITFTPKEEPQPRLIAFVTSNFDSECQRLMLNGAENEVKARGYRIVFCSTDNNQEELTVLKHLQEENVAGVLLWPNPDLTLTREQNIRNYGQIRIPIVLMDRAIHGGEYDCVTSDNYGGISVLMQHLIDSGHQNIVFLSHPATALTPIIDRYRAYEEAMTNAGLIPQPAWIVGEEQKEINAAQVLRACVDSSSPKLKQIISQIENAHPRPTAIVAVNDFVAIIAMRAIKLMGLNIPDDICVAGFDDTDLSVYLEVPLTTVAQDTFAIGKRAAQVLIERIDGRDGAVIYEHIPTELRVRTSTAVSTTIERR